MINPNNPAFPLPKGNENIAPEVAGLTKREYFAAMAMQGIVNHEMTYGIYNKPSTKETWRVSHAKEIAWYTCEMADALIAQLNK